jgi:5'-3' exonuclease
MSNLLYRTFFAHPQETDMTIAGLASHSALVTLNKYFREHKPDKMVAAFDRSSWRKEYTASEECVSKKPYKGNRRQTMTPQQKLKYEQFCAHLNEFEQLLTENTTMITLAQARLEADDVIAGFVQVATLKPENEIIIVSGDQDFMQLLRYDNVKLLDPATGKYRTLEEEYDNDADFFMFNKCIRGDKGDNVSTALPRIRSTRIKKAYTDKFEHANLMNETWKGPDGTSYVVKQLFKENQLLMDLTMQPDDIQKLIVKTVVDAMKENKKFSYFHFMRFLGKYELKKVAEQADNFVQMLSK